MPILHSNGIKLYYEVHGLGPALLFIHGLGSSTRDWEPQVAPFAESFRVVTFDLRGHGRSDKPDGPYSISMLAADTAGVLHGLGIESAHVVGLSLGGAIAFQLAVDKPDAVKTLTIVNSAPEWVPRSFGERMAIWQRLLIVRFCGMRKVGEVLSKRLFIKPEQEALRETFVQRWADNDKRAYLAALRALIGWSVTARLGLIQCPTLIIAADGDYSPVTFKETYAARIPDAQLLVIADSRHLTPIEHPRTFNLAVRDFLEKHC